MPSASVSAPSSVAVPERTGRAMDREYEEKLVLRVVWRGVKRLLLPAPVRIALAWLRAAGYIYKGLATLLRGKLEVPVLDATAITVSFLRGDDPGAEDVVRAAADAGFTSFRGAYFRYDPAKTMQANLDDVKRGFESLERLARKTGLKACYQNHSTYNPKIELFGSVVWDLAQIIRDFDPSYVGVQYDVMHAQAETGPSWMHSIGIVAPWIDILCLKDFWFEPDPKNPKMWRRHLCPAGEGIVPWSRYREILQQYALRPRYTVHFDYDFPEDEAGAIRCATADLTFYRSQLG